ncbi:hypothetical protein HBH56_073250 [Parastagonospora nodorum]|uniref:Bacteriophage T5 Orf172 DNA-binding domain-containing protein n=1 Tax=Phaeosphaeria nodorum (strain SN15 / ATCC MYA-4574 / FGSC 10173) TaxID=321614 RepID=A0A7U2IBI5_PHANO|nr:hypothetical protein HBH56_073250 [Parastagonospora nodorum]QRD06680.1 hypothetical protein JI435_135890 [Parastagonospora nodorum SN15]KAH3927483.1 hypothetical protein HBH54_153490 [Parastagonospora nodorum]KAH3952124.1 hypothetical protein HBH53_054880 [Parastagonospora nodorum]KAH3983302.1 hypothetical protein HBH52_067840 [Parastagonospora nodorum]
MSRSYSQMCPSRFPSPTPSRETSPGPSIRLESPSVSPQHPVPSLNFTASGSFRKRPRIADSQSEPVVPRNDDQASSPSPSYLSPETHATNRRRASDPLQGSMQSPNPGQRRRIRAVSAQSGRRPRSPRIARQPILLSTSQSSRLIDTQLREKLRETLTPKDAIGTIGTIYTFENPDRPDLGVKIGLTECADYTKRIESHRKRCKFEPDEIVFQHNVQNCFRTEQLILAELSDRRRYWECEECKPGKTIRHGEWSLISREEATTAVQKWTKFMDEQKPYDCMGNLTPLWSYLLHTRKFNEGADHDARREQWNAILAAPTYREYCGFMIDRLVRTWRALHSTILRIWPWCKAFFWQMSTLTYGFVALVAFRNALASSAFALFSLCACISAGPELEALLKSRRKS